MLTELTQHQKDMLPVYRDKWIKIGLACGETDDAFKAKAEEAMVEVYTCVGLKPPTQFIWVENPLEGIHKCAELEGEEGKGSHLYPYLSNACYGLHDAPWLSYYDFFDQETEIKLPQIRGLVKYAQVGGGWFWPFEDVVVMSPKPKSVKLNATNRLHAEGEAAIGYNGFGVYCYDGVRIPEKYGALPPAQWKAQWILEENNAELRRVLIQGIGYGRLLQELNAKKVDSWREYNLFKIENKIDVEPVVIVTMTCPSTSMMHVHRVPPDSTSARDAITWCNWGVDPEVFAKET